MGRIEYKYLVPNEMLTHIRDYIAKYVSLDKYAAMRQKKEYTVRSLYYDTLNFSFYHEKIEGIRKRKKIRTRGYNEFMGDEQVFLEIKRKNDAAITKTRASVEYRDLSALIETGDVDKFIGSKCGNGLTKTNALNFLFHINNLALMPKILINYEREAYYYKFNQDLRITFDKKLRSKIRVSIDGLFKEVNFVRAFPNYFILEIKTQLHFPSWLNYAIGSLELRQRALSKYTICLDSHKQKGLKIDRLEFAQKKMASINDQNFLEVA